MQAILKTRRNHLQFAMPLLAVVLVGVVVIVMTGAIGKNNATEQLAGTKPAGTGQQAQNADPWPAFNMVFREDAHDWATGKIVSSEVYRYAYTNRESWQLELLESTKDPRAVGSKTEYNNSTFTQASVIDGHPPPLQVTKADKPYMATWWLVPVAVAQLGNGDGYQRAADTPDGKMELYKEVTLPCSSLSDVWRVQLCGAGKQYYTQRIEKLMDPEHGIPLEITEKAGDQVTSTITVTELTYK